MAFSLGCSTMHVMYRSVVICAATIQNEIERECTWMLNGLILIQNWGRPRGLGVKERTALLHFICKRGYAKQSTLMALAAVPPSGLW